MTQTSYNRRYETIIENINIRIATKQYAAKLLEIYLSKDSMEFHKHLGYALIGEFHKCGFKFNHWYNMIWMEKFIGIHAENPLPVKTFSEVHHTLNSYTNA